MRNKFVKAVIFTLLGLAVWIVLAKAVDFVRKPQSQNLETINPSPTANPLGYFTEIKTSKGTIYLLINNEYIDFNANEVAVNNGTRIIIRKDDFPKLFGQSIANSNVLQATRYVDPRTGEEFIELSNGQPDHGGIAKVYVLLVDPFSGEIKEGLSDYQRPDR